MKRSKADGIEHGRNYEDSPEPESESTAGTWSKASEETLKQRVIVKAQRSNSSTVQVNQPNSNKPTFTLLPALNNNQNEKNEEKEEKKTEEKESNRPLTILMNPAGAGGWTCRACTTGNKKGVEKCAACGEPREEKKEEGKELLKIMSSVGAGAWHCKACTTANKQEATQCVACTEPNPLKEKPVDSSKPNDTAKAAFAFTAPSTASTFTGFTVPAAATFGGFSVPTTSTFTFGSSAPAFTFGSSSAAATFSFSNSGTGQSFSFSTATASNPFSSANATSAGDEETAGNEDPSTFEPASLESKQSDYAQLANVVKDKTSDGTGEESDETLKKCRIVLYQVKKVEEKFILSEAGRGDIHLNKVSDNKCRLLMRQEKTCRLLLNTLLHAHVKITRENSNLRFSTIDSDGSHSFVFRFKEKADAIEFLHLVEKHSGLEISKDDE